MPSRPPVGTVGLKSGWHRFWHGSDADPFDLTAMQANRQIQFVGDMQRLELRPDDVLVVSYDGHMTEASAKTIRGSLENSFAGHKVVVLADGLKLGVVCPTSQRADQGDEPQPKGYEE